LRLRAEVDLRVAYRDGRKGAVVAERGDGRGPIRVERGGVDIDGGRGNRADSVGHGDVTLDHSVDAASGVAAAGTVVEVGLSEKLAAPEPGPNIVGTLDEVDVALVAAPYGLLHTPVVEGHLHGGVGVAH